MTRDYQRARHEAGHCLRLHAVGWPVDTIDGAGTRFHYPVVLADLPYYVEGHPGAVVRYCLDGLSAMFAGSLAACGSLAEVSRADQKIIDELGRAYKACRAPLNWSTLAEHAEAATRAWLREAPTRQALEVVSALLMKEGQIPGPAWRALAQQHGFARRCAALPVARRILHGASALGPWVRGPVRWRTKGKPSR